jgi:hypothetical protein
MKLSFKLTILILLLSLILSDVFTGYKITKPKNYKDQTPALINEGEDIILNINGQKDENIHKITKVMIEPSNTSSTLSIYHEVGQGQKLYLKAKKSNKSTGVNGVNELISLARYSPGIWAYDATHKSISKKEVNLAVLIL